MQLAGIEGQQVVLLLEDYQFVHSSFLEMVNSLLSSGKIFYNPFSCIPILETCFWEKILCFKLQLI